ncbi:hypothetical protein TNCT_458721 [Trichonephila clavata]|uniref:Uncharacterized protein n=1 Tax=Trichonephila clavata TaxID=2740835 RepID=A0A8X6L530_TRICU|nr:hypothetical protein TNCT_458721 [Trichonephila clavata]
MNQDAITSPISTSRQPVNVTRSWLINEWEMQSEAQQIELVSRRLVVGFFLSVKNFRFGQLPAGSDQIYRLMNILWYGK